MAKPNDMAKPNKPLRSGKKAPLPEKPSVRGAVQSKTGFKDRSASYWAHHRLSLIDSLVRLLVTPVQSFMTAAVVGIALALPITLLLSIENLNTLGASWDANPKISVYLNVRARQEAIDQLISDLEADPDVASVQYYSPDEALRDFQKFSGFDGVLEALDSNPLPPTVVVSPKKESIAATHLQVLSERIKSGSSIVDGVSLDLDWVRRLQEIMRLGEKVVLALAILLSAGVLLAIGNTIRLAIENRREEILVTKLVGGTDAFVRRPFLYSGAWFGFFGGVIACLIVLLGYFTIEPTVQRLASLYSAQFSLLGLSLGVFMNVLAIATGLGWMGAWLAVGRHLTEIEPQ